LWINPRYYKRAKARLERYPNIKVFFGDSRKFLSILLDRNMLGNKPFFYLDAHWGSEWPLKDELNKICNKFESSIMIIDDFKVPDNPMFGFDIYSGEECSLATIVPHLDMNKKYSFLFPNYQEFDAFKKGAKHSPLTGYVLIFQNMEKEVKTLKSNKLIKEKFRFMKSLL